jgi:hypothetical protein
MATVSSDVRCSVAMRKKLCGRPIVQLAPLPGLSDLSNAAPGQPNVCQMHSKDYRQSEALFDAEIAAMRVRGDYDFTGFVFQSEAAFSGSIFPVPTTFDRATFRKKTLFVHVRFASDVSFDGAMFEEGIDFTFAYFGGSTSFANASLGPRHVDDLSLYAPTKVANFTNAVFAAPEHVTFRRVNHDSLQGFRLRALGCNVDLVNFEDVEWHRERGRMVLQDELDLRAWSHKPRNTGVLAYLDHIALQARYGSPDPMAADTHGLIAAAYTRLVINFDNRLNYDYAEDAFCGAMEVRRLDPHSLPLSGLFRSIYERLPLLAMAARSVTLLSFYKYVSYYGSSYRRALLVLIAQLLAFAMIFATLGNLEVKVDRPNSRHQSLRVSSMAALASLEIASFQRERMVTIHSQAGNIARIVESIVIPAQLAIALLAIRRRFKR